MTDPVNLRQARKAKQRRDKQQQAQRNRVKFGTSKLDRNLAKARRERQQHDLDHHKIEPD